MALLQRGARWDRMQEGAREASSSFPSDTWGHVGLGKGIQLAPRPPTGRGLLTGVLVLISIPEVLGMG